MLGPGFMDVPGWGLLPQGISGLDLVPGGGLGPALVEVAGSDLLWRRCLAQTCSGGVCWLGSTLAEVVPSGLVSQRLMAQTFFCGCP